MKKSEKADIELLKKYEIQKEHYSKKVADLKMQIDKKVNAKLLRLVCSFSSIKELTSEDVLNMQNDDLRHLIKSELLANDTLSKDTIQPFEGQPSAGAQLM